jgi:tryptophan-rich sensory protein
MNEMIQIFDGITRLSTRLVLLVLLLPRATLALHLYVLLLFLSLSLCFYQVKEVSKYILRPVCIWMRRSLLR